MPANIYELVEPLTRKYGEDIIQDALLKTWAKRPQLLEQPSSETVKYLTIAARNISINAMVAEIAEKVHIGAAFDTHAQEPPVDNYLEMEEYQQEEARIRALPLTDRRQRQLLAELRRQYAA